MIESITQVIVSLDGFFKKGLVELILLNGFFIYNNYFFDTSNSVQNLPYLYILKIFFSTFQLDFIRSNDTFSKNLRRLYCALILR